MYILLVIVCAMWGGYCFLRSQMSYSVSNLRFSFAQTFGQSVGLRMGKQALTMLSESHDTKWQLAAARTKLAANHCYSVGGGIAISVLSLLVSSPFSPGAK